MEAEVEIGAESVNLGIFDGEVGHVQINRAISAADKVILIGEQTRLPYFPEDMRLPKLHTGDPLVLLLWKDTLPMCVPVDGRSLAKASCGSEVLAAASARHPRSRSILRCSTLEARKELAVRELVSQYDECWPCLSAGSGVQPEFGRATPCLLVSVTH